MSRLFLVLVLVSFAKLAFGYGPYVSKPQCSNIHELESSKDVEFIWIESEDSCPWFAKYSHEIYGALRSCMIEHKVPFKGTKFTLTCKKYPGNVRGKDGVLRLAVVRISEADSQPYAGTAASTSSNDLFDVDVFSQNMIRAIDDVFIERAKK